MYNLLIADDEQLERDAIEFLINKKELPFNVLKAKNGKEALQIYNQESVDFIILDIKMPLINGIEVGNIIRENDRVTPIVYLTAWSNFDYAKSAISIGVLEYLVKPINKKELYKVLEDFIEKKEIETSTKNEEFKTVINQFSRSFFASMKHGLIDSKVLKKYFNLKVDTFFEGVSLIVSEVNIDRLKHFFTQKEFINSRFYYFPTTDRTTIIVFPKNKSKFFKQLNYNTNAIMSSKFNKITIAIGSVFTSIEELPRSIREASIAYNIARTNNETIHEFNNIDENILYNSSINYIDEIETAIFDLNEKKAREIAHKFYDSISHLEKNALLETYYQNVLILHHVLTKKIPFFTISKPHKSVVEIEITFFNMIDNAVKALIEDRRDRYQRIFLAIKKEIEIHYNKQLTMEYYSSLLNMNTKYFSKLFKTYNNISFIDYLTNIRLDKAKELLKEGISVKDSAKAVGYMDSAYFSKVFSQRFNINPSQFKQAYEK